jgi:hypothetical protein
MEVGILPDLADMLLACPMSPSLLIDDEQDARQPRQPERLSSVHENENFRSMAVLSGIKPISPGTSGT